MPSAESEELSLPTYTYACRTCGVELERRQSFSDPPLTVCESCGGALRKLIYPVGVIFKGSGFYNTDYRKASGNGSKPDGDGTAEKPKDGEGTDAKPAEAKKAESKDDSQKTAKSSETESTGKTPATTAKD
jgi:putative FmdB family regulatory protein